MVLVCFASTPVLSTIYEDFSHEAIQISAAAYFGDLAQGVGAAGPVFGAREPNHAEQARRLIIAAHALSG